MRALIVDEIGMLSGEFLDWLDQTVREVCEQPEKAFWWHSVGL